MYNTMQCTYLLGENTAVEVGRRGERVNFSLGLANSHMLVFENVTRLGSWEGEVVVERHHAPRLTLLFQRSCGVFLGQKTYIALMFSNCVNYSILHV